MGLADATTKYVLSELTAAAMMAASPVRTVVVVVEGTTVVGADVDVVPGAGAVVGMVWPLVDPHAARMAAADTARRALSRRRVLRFVVMCCLP
jgi:hypothetical protein